MSQGFYWLENDYDLSLQSDRNGEEFREIVISFSECVNQTDVIWESQDKIDEVIANSDILALVMTPYFDFNDLDNPIKYQLKTDLQMEFSSVIDIISILKIRQNYYSLHDSWFGFFGDESGTFYSYENPEFRFQNFASHTRAQILIQLDAQIDRYERTVQTLFGAIETVGGIYEIIKISIGLLIKAYNHKVYEYTTVKSIKDGIEDEDNLNESNNDEEVV